MTPEQIQAELDKLKQFDQYQHQQISDVKEWLKRQTEEVEEIKRKLNLPNDQQYRFSKER